MRTIQEYLKECDRKSIINDYIYEHAFSSLSMMDKDNRPLTVGEIIDFYTFKLDELIDKLIDMEPVKTEERWILLAYHQSEDSAGNDVTFGLFKESDIYNDGHITTYAYDFTPFNEAVGFYVADTYLTQLEINALIVSFLDEITFNGFDQEDLEARTKELYEACKEAKAHIDDPEYFISFEDFRKKLEDIAGVELEKRDSKQEEAWYEYLKHQAEYNEKCQRIEIEKLKELLKEEK